MPLTAYIRKPPGPNGRAPSPKLADENLGSTKCDVHTFPVRQKGVCSVESQSRVASSSMATRSARPSFGRIARNNILLNSTAQQARRSE